MMRDLTKSFASYTWAMSVFWSQQMFNALGFGASRSCDRSVKSFNHVTEATSNELGSTMRALFRGGDAAQRGMVDLLFMPFNLANSRGAGNRDGNCPDGNRQRDGGGWVDVAARAAQAGADAMQAAVDTTARTAEWAADSATDDHSQHGSAPHSHDPSVGWGPTPR
jgi:hypothetical protein